MICPRCSNTLTPTNYGEICFWCGYKHILECYIDEVKFQPSFKYNKMMEVIDGSEMQNS